MTPSTALGMRPSTVGEAPRAESRAQSRGFALMELLIVALLLSGIFMAATALHISSLKLLDRQTQSIGVNPLTAFEQIRRDIKKTNYVKIDDNGKRLTLRIEKNATDPPTVTPDDDDWVVYKIMESNTLRWETSAASGPEPEVTDADPQVVSGVWVSEVSSSFDVTNPSLTFTTQESAGNPTVVKLNFVSGGGPEPITTSVLAGEMSK